MLKLILRVLICTIGIVILNFISYIILSIMASSINGSSPPEKVAIFFRDILFIKINGISLSPALALLGLVAFIIYEYYDDKKNKGASITIKDFIVNDLIAVGLGNFIWGTFLFIVNVGIIAFSFFYLFFLKIPFSRGWSILMNPVFFKSFELQEESRFMLNLIYLLVFFVFLGLVFSRDSKYIKYDSELKDSTLLIENLDKIIYKNRNKLRFFSLCYLLYLTPVIFVWFYPILLYWFNQLPNNTNLIQLTFSYKILSYLFVAGFIFTISAIYKNNRSVTISDLKEEIKREIIQDELNKTQ